MNFDGALAQLDAHYQAMPPVAALRLRIAGFDGDCLRLQAPLASHVNDKGCAFGGSLVSLMTLAAWGLVTLRLQQAGLAADVFVADSQVRYLAPLFDDIQAEARLAEDAAWEDFVAELRERGRASVSTAASVCLPDGAQAAHCRARYVAIARG
ncbi:MAG TPA: YiiD C-terminal domain-containing protein [Luteimonas sp.]|nr:YiiD C-terminal domain-containing protein [Luteimonas sp.]